MRSSWLKVKHTLSDDFVIGGYTAGQGARARTFGAMLLGSYDANGVLHYVANAGTGFDDRLLAELKGRFDAIRTDERPFAEQPPVRQQMTWVRPELVAEVKFAERTHDGTSSGAAFSPGCETTKLPRRRSRRRSCPLPSTEILRQQGATLRRARTWTTFSSS